MKKFLFSPILISFLFCGLLCFYTAKAQVRYPVEQQLEEYHLIQKAYTSLHPGLYRYLSDSEVENNFQWLKQQLSTPRTQRELYVVYSRFLAQFRCGHTYCNFWNQPEAVKQEVFWRKDKLPFTFRLVENRMIITENVSGDPALDSGAEITHINGFPVPAILDSLAVYVKGDGFRNHKRISDLQVSGVAEYEAFDIYFPLLFEVGDSVDVTIRNLFAGETLTHRVALVSVEARRAALLRLFGKKQIQADDLWRFEKLNKESAYMQLGDFTTWTMKLDWRQFLNNSFEQLEKENIPNLIVDIRGNEGGADEVLFELAKYILKTKATTPCEKDLLRYNTVPQDLRPYLSTWDNSIFDLSKRLKPTENGYFTWKKKYPCGKTYPASRKAYQGKIYFLIDAANSSATFLLARVIKENNLGTLVGEETGGNMNGITGGMMFFMTLPHSQIEMDIPLIGSFAVEEMPDGGIVPDLMVKPDPLDIIRGKDSCLEKVKSLIAKQISE
ncbi:MAG: S41 family peptidase [Bacteroidia bacterium]